MLSLAVIVLLAHPEQLQALRAAPASINNAVEELLRYITEPQTSATTRMALEDVELSGMTIKAGESVTVSLAAANRDPAVFEHPDTLDLSRSKVRRQLAFGQGIHMCLGQHVGRLEPQHDIVCEQRTSSPLLEGLRLISTECSSASCAARRLAFLASAINSSVGSKV